MVYRSRLLVFCLLSLIFSCGCVSLKEGAKGFAGVSTRALEESRKDAAVKVFKKDYSAVVGKAKEALKEIGAYIYAEDSGRGMIAVYVSEVDTTPVGLFFTAVDSGSTRVEVSSPSTYGKEFIAGKVFPFVDGKRLKKKTAQEADAKKN
ncbi:MAG: hypothetical protein WC335_06695 [Candidatus Omnitrophota bacterium]|jgi:hypothetical protein